MENDGTEKHPLDKTIPPSVKPELRSLRKDDRGPAIEASHIAGKPFLQPDASHIAGKPFLQPEALDIVDGIRPSSSKTRSLTLLPAIQESLYEDKEDVSLYESRSSSSVLSRRHHVTSRVSSKPALTSISEELLTRTPDSVFQRLLSRVEEDDEEEHGAAGQTRSQGAETRKVLAQSFGDTATSVRVELSLAQLDSPNDASSQFQTPLSGRSHFATLAGGEGEVEREIVQKNETEMETDEYCTAPGHQVSIINDRCNSHPINLLLPDGSEEAEIFESSVSRGAIPGAGEQANLMTPGPDDLVCPSQDIRYSTSSEHRVDIDLQPSFLPSQSCSYSEASITTLEHGRGSEESCLELRELQLNEETVGHPFNWGCQNDGELTSGQDVWTEAFNEETVGRPLNWGCQNDLELTSGQDVWTEAFLNGGDTGTENLFFTIGEEQVIPMGDVLTSTRPTLTTEAGVFKPVACIASLNIYINQIVLGSLCEVIVQLALNKAMQDIEKDAPQSARPAETTVCEDSTAKPAPVSSRPKGSGSDSIVGEAAGSGADSSVPRESHSEHTTGSASSERQDKEFKDKDAKKQREKDTCSKQRGRERERNKRKRDREDRGSSAGKQQKLLRNAVGDVHVARDRTSTVSDVLKNTPTVSGGHQATVPEVTAIFQNQPTVRESSRQSSEQTSRSDDAGDVRDHNVKSSCGLESQTVTSSTEDSSIGDSQANRTQRTESNETLNEEDKSVEEYTWNLENSKTTTSRFGKRTSLHRAKVNGVANSHTNVSCSTPTVSEKTNSRLSSPDRDSVEFNDGLQQREETTTASLNESVDLEESVYELGNSVDLQNSPPHNSSHGDGAHVKRPGQLNPASLPVCQIFDESFNHPPKYSTENVSGDWDEGGESLNVSGQEPHPPTDEQARNVHEVSQMAEGQLNMQCCVGEEDSLSESIDDRSERLKDLLALAQGQGNMVISPVLAPQATISEHGPSSCDDVCCSEGKQLEASNLGQQHILYNSPQERAEDGSQHLLEKPIDSRLTAIDAACKHHPNDELFEPQVDQQPDDELEIEDVRQPNNELLEPKESQQPNDEFFENEESQQPNDEFFENEESQQPNDEFFENEESQQPNDELLETEEVYHHLEAEDDPSRTFEAENTSTMSTYTQETTLVTVCSLRKEDTQDNCDDQLFNSAFTCETERGQDDQSKGDLEHVTQNISLSDKDNEMSDNIENTQADEMAEHLDIQAEKMSEHVHVEETEKDVDVQWENKVEDVGFRRTDVENVNLQQKGLVESMDVKVNETVENADLQPEEDVENVDLQPEETVENVDLQPEKDVENVDLQLKDAVENVDLQEAVENVDLQPEEDVENVDLQPEEDVENVDLQEAVENVDLQLQEAVENVDLQEAVENVDLQEAVENVDLQPEEAVENVDLQLKEAVENVDLQEAVENVDFQQGKEVEYIEENVDELEGRIFDPCLEIPSVEVGAAQGNIELEGLLDKQEIELRRYLDEQHEDQVGHIHKEDVEFTGHLDQQKVQLAGHRLKQEEELAGHLDEQEVDLAAQLDEQEVDLAAQLHEKEVEQAGLLNEQREMLGVRSNEQDEEPAEHLDEQEDLAVQFDEQEVKVALAVHLEEQDEELAGYQDEQEEKLVGHYYEQDATLAGHFHEYDEDLAGHLDEQDEELAGHLHEQKVELDGHLDEQEIELAGHLKVLNKELAGHLSEQDEELAGYLDKQYEDLADHGDEQEAELDGHFDEKCYLHVQNDQLEETAENVLQIPSQHFDMKEEKVQHEKLEFTVSYEDHEITECVIEIRSHLDPTTISGVVEVDGGDTALHTHTESMAGCLQKKDTIDNGPETISSEIALQDVIEKNEGDEMSIEQLQTEEDRPCEHVIDEESEQCEDGFYQERGSTVNETATKQGDNTDQIPDTDRPSQIPGAAHLDAGNLLSSSTRNIGEMDVLPVSTTEMDVLPVSTVEMDVLPTTAAEVYVSPAARAEDDLLSQLHTSPELIDLSCTYNKDHQSDGFSKPQESPGNVHTIRDILTTAQSDGFSKSQDNESPGNVHTIRDILTEMTAQIDLFVGSDQAKSETRRNDLLELNTLREEEETREVDETGRDQKEDSGEELTSSRQYILGNIQTRNQLGASLDNTKDALAKDMSPTFEEMKDVLAEEINPTVKNMKDMSPTVEVMEHILAEEINPNVEDMKEVLAEEINPNVEEMNDVITEDMNSALANTENLFAKKTSPASALDNIENVLVEEMEDRLVEEINVTVEEMEDVFAEVMNPIDLDDEHEPLLKQDLDEDTSSTVTLRDFVGSYHGLVTLTDASPSIVGLDHVAELETVDYTESVKTRGKVSEEIDNVEGTTGLEDEVRTEEVTAFNLVAEVNVRHEVLENSEDMNIVISHTTFQENPDLLVNVEEKGNGLDLTNEVSLGNEESVSNKLAEVKSDLAHETNKDSEFSFPTPCRDALSDNYNQGEVFLNSVERNLGQKYYAGPNDGRKQMLAKDALVGEADKGSGGHDESGQQVSHDGTAQQCLDIVDSEMTSDNAESFEQWSTQEPAAFEHAGWQEENTGVDVDQMKETNLQEEKIQAPAASSTDGIMFLSAENVERSAFSRVQAASRDKDADVPVVMPLPAETQNVNEADENSLLVDEKEAAPGDSSFVVKDKQELETNMEAVVCVSSLPQYRDTSPFVGDGKDVELEEVGVCQEGVHVDDLDASEKLALAAAERDTTLEVSPTKHLQDVDEETKPLVKETKDGRRRVKKGAGPKASQNLTETDGAAKAVKKTPQKAKSADEGAPLKSSESRDVTEAVASAYGLRVTQSSPAPACGVKRLKIVDVKDFPKDQPCIYRPEEAASITAAAAAANKLKMLRTKPASGKKPVEPRYEKKGTLWKRLKSILKGPKPARRDGRFRFVKKYKQDLNSQTSVVVDGPSFRPATASDSMLQKGHSKHVQTTSSHLVVNQFSAGLGAGSNICTDHNNTWHKSTSPPKPLKHKTAPVKRNQWRRFRRLRVLRHSAEMMGSPLPPIMNQSVSSKNYIRMKDPLDQSWEEEAKSRKTSKDRRTKRNSLKRTQSPLLEHPKDAAASRRCELVNAATPEVFEVFCHEDEDVAVTKEIPTVRMLIKPRVLPTSDVSPETVEEPVEELAAVEQVKLAEVTNASKNQKKQSSSKRWRCTVM